MELDITSLINQFDEYIDPVDLSGSVIEHGWNAGQYTWNNCFELAKDALSDTDDDLFALANAVIEFEDDVRSHFEEYGAWSHSEIESWNDAELVAITFQEIAASYRELQDASDPEQTSGRLYRCDIEDHSEYGNWFFYLGA